MVWWRRLSLGAAGLALLAGLLAGLVVGLDRAFPPNLERAARLSPLLLDRDGVPVHIGLSPDGFYRLEATPDQVDPLFIRMLIAYEDKRFYRHRGVDPLALVRAGWQMLHRGRVVSGASTLTMQTARLLEPRPRGLVSKLIEMARAVQLEYHYDKARILSLYLTLAPYGGNVEGVEAASLRYFGKPPRAVTPAEAALLVALPQAPSRLRPDRHPEAARAARDKVLRQIEAPLAMDPHRLATAGAAAVEKARPLPRHAPHFHRRFAGGTQPQAVAGSLDADLQKRAGDAAKAHLAGLGPRANIAVLVVDNRRRAIRAYIGAAAPFSAARGGYVDMVRAVRSPGSALKPVLYALAFDRGLATPETLVNDVPTRFGDYAPRNFAGRHHGMVTMAEALQLSLNVPAVAVLNRLGPVMVSERLRRAGLRLDFGGPDRRPGLALALGGVGIRLADLVRLYAAFASDGRLAPLCERAVCPRPDTATRPIVGDQARSRVTRILRNAPPAPGAVPAIFQTRHRPIAVKTGTSYGYRDAWALGYDQAHTVGIWVGRPDGTPSPGRFGANTALPLLYRIFDLLPAGADAGDKAESETAPAPAAVPRLRYFDPPIASAANPDPVRITFPPSGVVLPVGPTGLLLEADGGARPLVWLVDGVPIPVSPWARRARWHPVSAGFAKVTVIDRTGAQAGSLIRIESVAEEPSGPEPAWRSHP